MRKVLLLILLIVLSIALVYKSPFSAMYNYNKARNLYERKQYEQSLPYFERSLFADKNGILARFYYTLALSKSKPTYSIQKKLYDMSNSKINDEATKLAKIQSLTMRSNLLKGLEINYIYNASTGNDILRWDIKSFPLKIYYENKNEVPDYYYQNINKALELWSSRTNFVKFEETKNSSIANIIIKFKEYSSKNCENGICKYVVAYTEPKLANDKTLSQMILTFYKTNPQDKNFSSKEIFNTALHEIGHTLGIMGHSDNEYSIMYPQKNEYNNPLSFPEQELKTIDLNTLVLLYRLEPTISNTKNLKSENFYYPPLILGNDNVRILKKLEEIKRYIKEYPTMPAGYINIASVYADLAEFDVALSMLDKAETLAQTTDEKYLIQYNRAIIYFNKQNYDKASNYAHLAKTLKNNQDINDFIYEIEQIKNN
jgi:tetratricopeptide (TPR) repeat protein